VAQCGDPAMVHQAQAQLNEKYSANPGFKKMLDISKDLLVIKEQFVHAWIDKYRHFGQRYTSRGEGAHRTLKSSLNHSQGDLLMVNMEQEWKEEVSKMEADCVTARLDGSVDLAPVCHIRCRDA
jgi:hypothetical protein